MGAQKQRYRFSRTKKKYNCPDVLNRSYVPIEPEYIIILDESVVNHPTEPITEVPLRRLQHIKRPEISYGYIYLHESDFNIGQSNGPSSYGEVLDCSDSDSWFTAMQEETNQYMKIICGIFWTS